MEFPRRVFDGEGVKADVDFGPTLMLNRNRCILCTRCIRFMKEIDGDAQIGIAHRGSGSELATFEEQGVISLLSGNLMDVCPVGAITTRDYRFKSRPWDNPHAVDTICTFCEKGCNTTAWIKAKPEWAKGAQLIRMTPRFNADVNQFWMCDIGRFDYHWVESDRRLLQPHVRRGATADAVAWDAAIAAVGDAVKAAGGPSAVRFLVSGARLARRTVRAPRTLRRDRWRDDELAPSREAAAGEHEVHGSRRWMRPTSTARRTSALPSATRAGPPNLSALKAGVEAGRVKVLFVLDSGPDGSIGETDWILAARKAGKIATLIVQGVLHTPLADAADIVLPGRAFVEKDATFTNMTGHVQASSQVITPPGDAGEDWQILTKLAGAFGSNVSYASAAAVRQAIAHALADKPAYAVLGSDRLRAPRVGSLLAPVVEPVRALEVGLHVPGPAARQVRGGFRPDAARGRDSAERSEIRPPACEVSLARARAAPKKKLRAFSVAPCLRVN